VAAGAHADLIAIDGNPLEDISLMEQRDCYTLIMRAGRIIKSSLRAPRRTT
jgi:imidazolonepropionase-like amidohydrolase